VNLKTRNQRKAFGEIDYFVSCKNGDVSKFVAKIEWNGEFKSRATDMIDVLKVQIEEK